MTISVYCGILSVEKVMKKIVAWVSKDGEEINWKKHRVEAKNFKFDDFDSDEDGDELYD